MGRWGEEEKKSKGIFGCLFALAVLGLFMYTFSRNYPQLQARAAMEKKLGSMILKNWRDSEFEIKEKIRDLTIEEGGQITIEDIEVNKSQFESSWKFKVWVRYPIEVDLIITQFETNYPIYFEQMVLF
jgi:hypothetical protein